MRYNIVDSSTANDGTNERMNEQTKRKMDKNLFHFFNEFDSMLYFVKWLFLFT